MEETLDEEDYNTTLHASSIEEMDDFDEEETLEGAADLGTMLREMSIDHITRSGTGDEEEDLTTTSKKRTPFTTPLSATSTTPTKRKTRKT